MLRPFETARRWPVALVALLAVVALVAAGLALRPRPVTAQPGRAATLSADPAPPLAAFIGDSYATGTGASSTSDRWTSTVARDQGWRELNLARGGTGYLTASSFEGCGAETCPNYQVMLKQAVRARAAIVVVAGGQSDQGNPSAAEHRAVLATYEALREGLPDARIIAVGPSSPARVPGSAIKSVDRAVREAAAGAGATYVSLLSPPVIRPTMVLDDGVHVSDAGHAAIARRVIGALS